jgi:hypothetical protein
MRVRSKAMPKEAFLYSQASRLGIPIRNRTIPTSTFFTFPRLDYHLAFIGADFDAPRKEDFDTAYMRALFDYGYQLGRKGYPWHKAPLGLTVAKTR